MRVFFRGEGVTTGKTDFWTNASRTRADWIRIERVRQSSRSSVKSSNMNEPAFCSNTRKPADGPLDEAVPLVVAAAEEVVGGGGGTGWLGLLLVTTTFVTGNCFVSGSVPLVT